MTEDFSIFQNQEDVAENIKKAAEAVGVQAAGIDKIKEGKPLEFYVAKKNCKQCWGVGIVSFVPNKPKKEINTSLPEDRLDRRDRIQKALCRCVRIQME